MDLDFVSELLLKLLLATLPILSAQLMGFLFQVYKAKRAELNLKQQALLDFGVYMAIQAAEQVYGVGEGDKKKEYALTVAEDWVAKYGLTLDFHLLEAKIEAEVYSQFNKDFPPQLTQG